MARILVNLLSYTGTKGGMETYAKELYRQFGSMDTGHEFVGFGSTEFMTKDYSWFPGEVVASGISGENRFHWAYGEMFSVSRAAHRLGADLVHSPANLGPWRTTVPAVYTMHDMLYFRVPDLMAKPLFTKPMQWLERRMAPNAALILTDSIASKEDIEEFLRQPSDRVRVVPLAGTPPFELPATMPEREPDLILAIGMRLPHKNFEGIVRAIAHIPEAQRPRLVVTGSRGDDPLRPLVAELGLEKWVELKGWVTNEELEWLYLHATALIDACVANGFCLPALEAMLVGLPVLLSDIPVYHEVGGDAAAYFDTLDVASIADTIQRATSSPQWMSELSAKGYGQAAKFTWAKTAAQTLVAFDDALSLGARRR
jgi:glycosyltransferase involved in cell wall biosynthesis